MKLNHKSEKEMKDIADKYSDSITIREYDNGSSRDYKRKTTPEEKNILKNAFYSAMWTINYRLNEVDDNLIQAIKDMAEMTVRTLIKDCNAYDSIYIPFGNEIDKWQKESRIFEIKGDTLNLYLGVGDRVVEIPDGIKCIGDSAFSDCNRLTSITVPDSVTSIGKGAFYCCTNLTGINIPDSVTEIGKYAFFGCESLTSINIPDSVTSIGWYAFFCCTSLTSITIPDSVTEIGKDVFKACDNLTIKCNKGSYVEQFAKENHIPVKHIKDKTKTIEKE